MEVVLLFGMVVGLMLIGAGAAMVTGGLRLAMFYHRR